MRWLVVCLVAVGAAMFGERSPSAASPGCAMLTAVNVYRTAQGVPAVQLDRSLVAAAQAYAEVLVRRGGLSHVGDDGSLPWDRARAWGYPSALVAENLVAGAGTDAAALALLRASPAHDVNLRDPRWRGAGFGWWRGADGRAVWTQLFGDFVDPAAGSVDCSSLDNLR